LKQAGKVMRRSVRQWRLLLDFSGKSGVVEVSSVCRRALQPSNWKQLFRLSPRVAAFQLEAMTAQPSSVYKQSDQSFDRASTCLPLLLSTKQT
jgi:hypothetical protein